MLYVKHHLQMSQCTENIFNYQEAFDFVEKHIKIFIYVVHIRVSLVCILICPDVKEKMTCPDVNLRRTWSICHIRLKIDKTCVDLISQKHAFCSCKICFRNHMFLVIFNCSVKLFNGV